MPSSRRLIIYTDGGARSNPGPAGIGIAIYRDFPSPLAGEGGWKPDEGSLGRGTLIKTHSAFLGEKTNNEAEYEAVIAALKLAAELSAEEIEFRLDSELVARQLTGAYKAKNHRMQELMLQVRNLETNFKKVSYKNIRREQNAVADGLVNEAIDKA